MSTVIESYGQAEFKGRHAKDDFCFQLAKCVSLDFLYIDDQISSLDGDVDAILGFARPGEKFKLSPGAVKRDALGTMYL